ncbi:MAG: ABC transporter ATP-binding protein [Gammaproteobacteria bacterium]|nr:ABC transporter ATP-binding protein [Gammaproteobacteria bacterium]
MLEITEVSKGYDNLLAVDNLNLKVKCGEIFGLLGPNGAGKTTSISMISGLVRPDSGQIQLAGIGEPHLTSSRQSLGVAPQTLALYEPLTPIENLTFFGKMYGLEGATLKAAVQDALVLADLESRKDDAVSGFSGGMKRRLNLAAAMIHKPKLLLLDEPTVGVDPQSRNVLLENISALRDQGHTIIYTTHYMEEAQKICDRVAIMDKGKILALGTVSELIQKHGGDYEITIHKPDSEEIIISNNPVQILDERNIDPNTDFVEVRPPNLEQVFFNLTGKQLRD